MSKSALNYTGQRRMKNHMKGNYSHNWGQQFFISHQTKEQVKIAQLQQNGKITKEALDASKEKKENKPVHEMPYLKIHQRANSVIKGNALSRTRNYSFVTSHQYVDGETKRSSSNTVLQPISIQSSSIRRIVRAPQLLQRQQNPYGTQRSGQTLVNIKSDHKLADTNYQVKEDIQARKMKLSRRSVYHNKGYQTQS